jgi:hypothetical protein
MNLVIPANKKRIPVALIIGLIICVLFFKFFKNEVGFDFNRPLYFVQVISLMVIVAAFTFIALVEYIKTLFDKKASLTISENGITDNLSIFSCGEISWAEVIDIKIEKWLKKDALIIMLANPVDIFEKQNKLKRRALKSNLKKFGSPMVILETRINYNLQALKNKMLQLKNK